MPTSEQLEREAKASRERLSRTIDELKVRLTPASMVDEATAYLRRAVDEPIVAEAPAVPARGSRYALPLVLMGAGLTWLAVEAGRAERERARRQRLAEAVSDEVALAAASEASLDPDLAALDRAIDSLAAVAPGGSTADTLPAVPEHGRSLASVESVSIAPAPIVEEEETRVHRSFP